MSGFNRRGRVLRLAALGVQLFLSLFARRVLRSRGLDDIFLFLNRNIAQIRKCAGCRDAVLRDLQAVNKAREEGRLLVGGLAIRLFST